MTAAPVSSSLLRVALIGNPNTGKSTLFNRLTGARQKIGNYPGVTVERKSGAWEFGGRRVELVDLPGAYSLAASSPDELVAFDFLTGHLAGEAPPDVVICVVDASNIVRNLFLASQVADLGLPLVIALNMSDAAEKAGIRVDAHLLSRLLGVPVVRTVAT
ncbi:MAG: FeoB small GTPase domain-containing protein, partial [Chthoniobacterales bacterium]